MQPLNLRLRATSLAMLVVLGCAPAPARNDAANAAGSAASGGASVAGAGGVSAGGSPGGGSPSSMAGGSVAGGDGGGVGGAGGALAEAACGVEPSGDVVFSPPSGAFRGRVTVSLRSSAATDELRYTTDHSAPTSSSPLYGGPLTFESSTDLRVQVFAQGAAVGEPSGAVYLALGADTQHDLPLLLLDTFGSVPVSDDEAERPFIDAAVLGLEPTQGSTSLTSSPSLASQGAVHVRGQSSARYDKKPYRLELRRANSADRDCPMFGMPSESDWVLHAPFPDKSLIRNAFAYSLGKDLGLAAPRTAFVELYLNTDGQTLDAADYQGVYLLVETIKNHKSRLNLQQLEPVDTMLPALAGGYIFKFEWRVTNLEQPLPCPSAQSNCWDFIEVVDPKPWVPEQQQYLTQHLQSVVNALHSAAPADPGSGYPSLLDVDSFVNTVIMNELTRNLDAYVRSQFLHKDRDGKVIAGPLWDFDLIAGVGSTFSNSNLETAGFQYEASESRLEITADWFPILIADAGFEQKLVARFKELRQGVLSDAQIDARIAMLSQGLAGGATRNFQKWDILGTARVGNFQTPTADSWQGQLSALRSWLGARLAWLDTQWT
jgi:hypothetical protein